MALNMKKIFLCGIILMVLPCLSCASISAAADSLVKYYQKTVNPFLYHRKEIETLMKERRWEEVYQTLNKIRFKDSRKKGEIETRIIKIRGFWSDCDYCNSLDVELQPVEETLDCYNKLISQNWKHLPKQLYFSKEFVAELNSQKDVVENKIFRLTETKKQLAEQESLEKVEQEKQKKRQAELALKKQEAEREARVAEYRAMKAEREAEYKDREAERVAKQEAERKTQEAREKKEKESLDTQVDKDAKKAGAKFETCDEARKRWVNYDMKPKEIKEEYDYCLAKKKRDNEYLEWRKNPINAYYVAKHTIIGRHGAKEKYIRVYNSILSKGGIFNVRKVRAMGGLYVTEGWTIARIIERVPGSNVVKIQYRDPYNSMNNFGSCIREGWIIDGSLPLLEEYKKSLKNNMAR